MRIMVTGAAGFIGSWVAEELVNLGHFVMGVDDLSGGFLSNIENVQKTQPSMFRFYQCDVGDKKKMEEVFLAHRPEIVVHCAANAREGASFYCPDHIVYSNAMISGRLLELAIKHKTGRFIFFSSMAIYGNGKPPFDEKMARKPVDIYGTMKAATEAIIEQLAQVHGFSYVIIRPHNYFGERQSLADPFRNVVGLFMNRIMRSEPLYIFGEGHTRAFSYIQDSLPCLLKAILDGGIDREIINIGGKEEVRILDMAHAVINSMCASREAHESYEIRVVEPRHGEVPHAFATYKKSEELLGYKEEIGWKEGVRRMAGWAKNRGPQPWRYSPLPLLTKEAPEPWRELQTRRSIIDG